MNVYCKNCGTENEEKYSFCKNCGTPLRATDSNRKKDYSYDYYADKIPDEIDGIPSSDFAHFVRDNRYKILDKFAKMSITGSKLSWCWPAAVLSFFFGFFGAAIWLFYRKMYRYAIIALCIGAVVLGVNTAITYTPSVSAAEAFLEVFIEMQTGGGFQQYLTDFEALLDTFSATREVMAVNFINELANYSAAFFYGLFGMYIYKKHAVKKISAYRLVNSDSVYYSYGLSALGGTSAGMAVLAIIIAVTLNNIISMLPFFAVIF